MGQTSLACVPRVLGKLHGRLTGHCAPGLGLPLVSASGRGSAQERRLLPPAHVSHAVRGQKRTLEKTKHSPANTKSCTHYDVSSEDRASLSCLGNQECGEGHQEDVAAGSIHESDLGWELRGSAPAPTPPLCAWNTHGLSLPHTEAARGHRQDRTVVMTIWTGCVTDPTRASTDLDSSRYGKRLPSAAPKPSRRVDPLLLKPASFCGWFPVTPGKFPRKVAFSSQQEISWERWRPGLELGHRRWGGRDLDA